MEEVKGLMGGGWGERNREGLSKEVTVHRGGTWAQRGEVTFPRSHSWKVEELGLGPALLASSFDLGTCLPEAPTATPRATIHMCATHWHSVSTPSSWRPHELCGVITSTLQVQKRPRGGHHKPRALQRNDRQGT